MEIDVYRFIFLIFIVSVVTLVSSPQPLSRLVDSARAHEDTGQDSSMTGKTTPPPEPYQPDAYSGIILSLSKERIIIKLAGKVTTTDRIKLPEGSTKELVYRQNNNQPPQIIFFQNGRIHDSFFHSFDDLNVGDCVSVCCHYRCDDGRCYCEMIRIINRPNGKIPLTSGEKKELKLLAEIEMLANKKAQLRKTSAIPVAPAPREIRPRTP